ncbi:uncharacterized protein CIMG_04226 [Coccidioides immitis RS]|uniref:DUF1279 domain-containing protein n=4 Tax=Coccidioides immitis TaxID=5501 RepID=J3KD25_COCIM|nr:uncharacterized protein CIMG_04226 [Coccidioides immitis RS]EAS33202.3 hypothetical protein CIMG_04226 [Coccidioides immitis RS]KMP08499.1 hypothetical protein CIRG_08180 [Coccidioides immitis RMSCC 2394]KMU87312.1 hypothetical protein CIHG_04757 [Coccidioides immitis H538.4]TPX20103.1 hypothetical protein DIZ76_017900 [Coccidioides immitis]
MSASRLFAPFGTGQLFHISSESRGTLSFWSVTSSRTWRPIQLPTVLRSSLRSVHTSARPLLYPHLTQSSARRATASIFFRPSSLRSSGRSTRRWNSTNSSPPKPPSFSERMRKLSREYGWSALGIYLLLSALDFPFCFAAVRLLGVERIGHYEHVVVESMKNILRPIFGARKDTTENLYGGDVAMATSVERAALDHGVMKAGGKPAGEEASIWTQLALAYAVHKSLIFLRVPLTAAVTPKVVKTLRRWGWDIGRRKPKSG